jgi:hypothetical protein
MPKRSRLVTDPGSCGDGGHGLSAFRLADDRLVQFGTFVATTLLDHEAEIHTAPSEDVLHRLTGPDATVRHAVAVHEVGDID